MNIIYKTDVIPTAQQVINLYNDAGLNRPTDDAERIAKMYQNASLVLTAWDGDQLVGAARSVTDFCYCCYLSDLAVLKDFQKSGIGKELVMRTKAAIGDECMLLLLSVPTAMEYYPKIGMEKLDNAFMIKRSR